MVIRKITKPFQDFQRFIQILSILTKYGFGYIIDLLPFEKNIFNRLTKTKKIADQELTLGERIRNIAENLGPTFIKLGQILSTRPDLIPLSICEELEKLQDRVQPFEYNLVEEIFRQSSLGSPESLFKEFRKTPFAAASLSQVHQAILPNGEKVAVKVQRPGIRKTLETDLEILTYLASLIHRYIEESRVYDLVNIVNELKKNTLKEIDFSIEARNIQKFRENFKNDPKVHYVKVFPEFSSNKILTMEKLEGIKINHISKLKEEGYDLQEIARIGSYAILKQIFEDGFFHADPHPGNIFVLPGPRLAFIDFGMVGRLDEPTLIHLASLFTSLIKRDVEGIIQAMVDIHIIDEFYQTSSLRIDLIELIDRFYGIPLKYVSMEKVISHFLNIVSRHQLKLPVTFTFLIKSLVTLETIGRSLNPDFNVIEEAKPFVFRLIRKKYSLHVILNEAFSASTDLYRFLRFFPKDIRHVLNQVKKGKLKIEFEHKGLESTLITLTYISNRIVLAIILSSLIIGSSLIVLSGIPPKVYGVPLIGIAGFIGAGVIGLYLLIVVLRHIKLNNQ